MIDTLLQIIPADGWVVVYFCADEPYYFTNRIPCFALGTERWYEKETGNFHTTGERVVVPLVLEGDATCPSPLVADNAYCVIHISEIDDELKEVWRREGKKWAEERK